MSTPTEPNSADRALASDGSPEDIDLAHRLREMFTSKTHNRSDFGRSAVRLIAAHRSSAVAEAVERCQTPTAGLIEMAVKLATGELESERDSLLVQVENQASIIRDTATPANERELRMLDELYSLRALVVRLKEALVVLKQEDTWRIRVDIVNKAVSLLPSDLSECVVVPRLKLESLEALNQAVIGNTRYISQEEIIHKLRGELEATKTADAMAAADLCVKIVALEAELTALRPEAKGGAK